MLSILALIFYYSTYPNRIDVHARWKGGSKAEKLRESALVYAMKLVSGSMGRIQLEKILSDVISLLTQCWDNSRGIRRKL